VVQGAGSGYDGPSYEAPGIEETPTQRDTTRVTQTPADEVHPHVLAVVKAVQHETAGRPVPRYVSVDRLGLPDDPERNGAAILLAVLADTSPLAESRRTPSPLQRRVGRCSETAARREAARAEPAHGKPCIKPGTL
jgi:hypothetical protein